jgi:pilus assembly protein CpaE
MTTTILVAGNSLDVEELFRGAGIVTRVAVERLEGGASVGLDRPSVLVADLRGRTRLPAWVSDWRRRSPNLPVVLVASSPDPALVLAAMRSGITECLVEPVTRADAEAAIWRVTVGGPGEPGEIFAFIGAKGGVGTTTLAVNAAVALSRAAGGTLFVDLNLAGGDAAILLGGDPRFSVLDALANTHRADEAFFRGLLTTTPSGVPLLASPAAPFASPIEPARLGALLDFARQRYRHIVIDVPRNGSGAREVLEVASVVVIVANQELATLRSAAVLAAAARERRDLDSIRAVLNRYDDRAALDNTDIEDALGLPVAARIPSDYRAVADAASRMQPLVTSKHRVGRSIAQFARELARVPADDERGLGVLSRMSASVAAALSGGF